MNENEIDWKYRFANFKWTFIQLEHCIGIENLSEIQRKELILFFEVSFDLSIKTLIDFLKTEGIFSSSAKEALVNGSHLGLIEDVNIWQQALEKMISSNNSYDEQKMPEIATSIQMYYKVIKKFLEKLQAKMPAIL